MEKKFEEFKACRDVGLAKSGSSEVQEHVIDAIGLLPDSRTKNLFPCNFVLRTTPELLNS
jgi:hypothetical protein